MKRIDLQEQLKLFLHQQLVNTRLNLGLTQAEMANLLVMDTRSYIELDHGRSMCGTLTLILFLTYCCSDPILFLDEVRNLFEGADSNVS